MSRRKRAAKTISRQYELFVEELENNAVFSNSVLDKTWKNLVAKLNTCGGPQRPVDVWKRIFIDWKSHIRRKDKLLKMKNHSAGTSDNKLSDLEVRLLRFMRGKSHSVQPNIQMQPQDPIVIENNDHIEFVNEEGAIISNIDKLEFICHEPLSRKNTNKAQQLVQGTVDKNEQTERHTQDNQLDTFLEACSQVNDWGLSFKEEVLVELKGIRSTLEKQLKELQVQNETNKLQAQIVYEKAKAKYKNFNMEIEF